MAGDRWDAYSLRCDAQGTSGQDGVQLRAPGVGQVVKLMVMG